MCVNVGPMGDDAIVPRIVWHPMHALREKIGAKNDAASPAESLRELVAT